MKTDPARFKRRRKLALQQVIHIETWLYKIETLKNVLQNLNIEDKWRFSSLRFQHRNKQSLSDLIIEEKELLKILKSKKTGTTKFEC